MPDNTNIPQFRPLMVEETTLTSISFSWEKWIGDTADPKSVSYQIWLTEEENPADPWRLVKEGKGLAEWTIGDLQPDTGYGIIVQAFEDDALVCHYPHPQGCLTVRTEAPDTAAPTVDSKAITVTAVTYNSISIKWEPATDSVTEKDNIRYKVWQRTTGASNDAWKAVKDKKAISTYTLTGLKLGTKYDFYIEAIDEAGNVLRYPSLRGYKTASTLADTVAPTAKSRELNVTGATLNSISIKWEAATDDITQKNKIRYEVWCKPDSDPNDSWTKVEDKTGITSYTFNNLKEDTKYVFYVKAFDEAGNFLQYPFDNGSKSANTVAPDRTAPNVKSRDIIVTETTRNSISIQWEPATDNVTKQNRIKYQIWFFEPGVDTNWRKIDEKYGISSYTFKNLKEATEYDFNVKAFDEAGNLLQYPLDNGCMSAKTASSDAVAPTVKSRAINVTGTTRNSISIKWEAATDNVTQQSKIKYEIFFFQPGVDTYWQKIDEKYGISSYTFKNLKAGAEYNFFIKASDEVGNYFYYPVDNGCMSAKTKA